MTLPTRMMARGPKRSINQPCSGPRMPLSTRIVANAIEKTHALASIWFCVMRQPRADDSPTRHSDLVVALCGSDPATAADAVRQHLVDALRWTLDILEPYFKLRTATGRTFYRTDRKLPAPLH